MFVFLQQRCVFGVPSGLARPLPVLEAGIEACTSHWAQFLFSYCPLLFFLTLSCLSFGVSVQADSCRFHLAPWQHMVLPSFTLVGQRLSLGAVARLALRRFPSSPKVISLRRHGKHRWANRTTNPGSFWDLQPLRMKCALPA